MNNDETLEGKVNKIKELQQMGKMFLEILSEYDLIHTDRIAYVTAKGVKLDSYTGLCELGEKKIYIARKQDAQEVYRVIIHEIAHAYADKHFETQSETKVDKIARNYVKLIFDKHAKRRKRKK